MATLTPADYGELRKLVYRAGDGKEEMKAWASIPNEVKLLQIFQAIEDRMVAASLQARGDIETLIGQPLGPDATSRATALRKLIRAWMRWRDRKGG